MVLSSTVSEIWRLIGKNCVFSYPSLIWRPRSLSSLWNFGEVNREETRVMGLLGGESCKRLYRAMHYIAKRGIAIACCASVRLSVVDQDHIGRKSWNLIAPTKLA